MFKRLSSLFMCGVLVFSTSSLAFADSSSQGTLSENRAKFQQLDGKIRETNSQISALDVQIDKLNETIDKNNKDISLYENQIKDAEVKMEQLKTEVDSKQQIVDKRVKAMYVNNSDIKYITLLLQSHGILDFIAKFDAIKKIVSYDKQLLNDLNAKKENLNKSISDLDSKTAQLQSTKDSNVASLQQINNSKKSLEALVQELSKEKQAVASVISQNEEGLIAHAVAVINSPSSTMSDIQNAIETLKSLLPQLSTPSVIKEAQNYISIGKQRIASMSDNSSSSRGGGGTYKAVYTMTATAYSGGGVTAIGTVPVRNPNGLSTIAVDPNVIPLGTEVYVTNYGKAIAADTGGAIKGNIIDLYMNSESECNQWGRRTVQLYVIAYPGEW